MADLHVGILAEDDNDCEVIDVLIRRLLIAGGARAGGWKVHHRSGHGCSKLRRKAEPWMRDLAARGCTGLILVHDRDRDEEERLRQQLCSIPVPQGARRLICIPVEEIEAWFFASRETLRLHIDPEARDHPSPHLIPSPKEKLIAMSRGANRKPRYSPNDNAKLAESLELDVCAHRCPAFRELRRFVEALWSG